MTDKGCPGDLATPELVLALANEYRRASEVIHTLGRRGEPLSRAPFRLTAIHAIELYLSAVLLGHGRQPNNVRSLGHGLFERAKLARERGLCLRKRTLEHLSALDANREYLVSRYGPELLSTASQINRLKATLDEVAEKAATAIKLATQGALTSNSSTASVSPSPTRRRGRSCR